jgi:hypothetical protein
MLRSADGFVGRGGTGDVLVGDFDGEGASDIAVYRPSTGQWFILGSSPPHTPIQVTWGTVGDIPVPADFDGDGVTDIAVYRPSTGQWFIFQSSTKTVKVVQWGGIGDIPILKQP